jgi:cytochrome o ubiquinol oxidase subunit I
VPPADFILHNSLFLVAHFHNVIIGGVLFGLFAGMNYWWPKAFGFRLETFWGTISFWCWAVGFWVAFGPLYVLGLMGVTRRVNQFDEPGLQVWFVIAACGAAIIAAGIATMLIQIGVSIWRRDSLRDVTGDPWGGRTLEWATASPPPAYNFAFTPVVHDLDAWSDMKSRGYARPLEGFRAIHMPKNTWAGVVLAALSTVFGFAMIWYIWWLAALSFAAIIATAIAHTFDYDRDFHIPAEAVVGAEGERTRLLSAEVAAKGA